MDLRVLEYFIIIAEEENITKAAEQIHISQPTLSRQMMQLEEELGCDLLIRRNKNVLLTEEGRILKDRAKEILELVNKTKQELLSSSDQITGDIYIGTMETQPFQYLAQQIHIFQDHYRKVHFHISTDNSAGVLNRIDKGLIDIGFIHAPLKSNQYLFKKLKLKEYWGMVVPTDHSLASKDRLVEDDLIGEPLICPKRQLDIGFWNRWTDAPEKFNVIGTYDLMGNAMMMVKEHMGLVLCLNSSAYFTEGLKFIPLEPEVYEKEVYLIWKKDHVFTKATECFINQLIEWNFIEE